MRTALIIPCFNEAERLDTAALRAALEARPWLTVWGVDDGSTDATWEIWQGLRHERIRSLRLTRNQGKGEAVRHGLLAALDEADAVAYWDADLATPIDELDALVRVLRERPGVQLVMGSRVKLLGRTIERDERRHYLGRVFATLVSLSLSLEVYDTQCGAKVLRASPQARQWLQAPFSSRWVFDVELLMRMRQTLGAELARAVVEVPLGQWVEQGDTRIRTAEALRMPLDLWRLWRRYRSSPRMT